MNDTDRATILRNPQEANTPEGWTKFRQAVDGVRSDLQASNIGKQGEAKANKWAVRYPNGSRPANEADTIFMANARKIVLDMMDEIEALNPLAQHAADMDEGFDNEIARLTAMVDTANDLIHQQGEIIAGLLQQNKVEIKTPTSETKAHLAEAEKKAPAKRTKRITKAEAPGETTSAPETAETALPVS